MEPSEDLNFAGALRTWWALLVVLTVVGAVTGFAVSTAMSPVYKGTASVLVGDFDNGEVSNNEIQAMQSLTATYADIGRREPVLADAAKDLGLGSWRELRGSVHVVVPKESPQVIEIAVEGSDRTRVKQAAGAVANSLVRYVDPNPGAGDFVSPQLRRLEQAIADSEDRLDDLRAQQDKLGESAPASLNLEVTRTQAQIAAWQDNYASFKQLASTSSQVAIRVLDPADAARTPVRPNVGFNTVMAGFAGLLLGLAIAYLLGAGRSPGDLWPRLPRGRRPDSGESRAQDGPLIAPADLTHVTTSVNGRALRPAGSPGRAGHHPEGDARWVSSRR